MNRLKLDFSVLLIMLLFTTLYATGAYYAVQTISHLVYQVVTALMLLILYINILRFLILEFCNLSDSRWMEFFMYFVMYCVTIVVTVTPFVLEQRHLYESPTIRIIIISFATLLLTKYCVFMLLGPWHDIVVKLRHRLYFEDVAYQPLVTVIIPAWNEAVGIVSTIQSLLKSSYRNLEIIVINDGSTDQTDEVICRFLQEYLVSQHKDIQIKYRLQENGGKGAALNHALCLAQGEIIISIDADCYVDREAVAAFVKTFKDPKVMASVGNVKIGNKNNTVGIVQYLEFLFSFYFKRADALLGSIYIIGGAAGAFRREVFEQLGGYNTTNITEDIELTMRMQDAGMKLEYTSDAVVYTEGADNIASLKRQRLRWKRGRFQTFWQYRHMFFSYEKRHNKFLSWVIMPLALVQEVQLLLEIPFLIFLYVFSILNSDFTSYLLGVCVVGMMFVVQFVFYDKSTRRLSFILLAPIGWLLFYVATYVESWALVKSIESFVFKRQVTWQRWERKGVGAITGHK